MNIEKIRNNLDTKYIGKNIIYRKTIDSTQKEAKELADSNIQNGSIVITNMQTKGIGTHGRTWMTDSGKNILMTIIIYPGCSIDKLEGLTIDIAECLANVIRTLYNIKLDIKEPNDLMLDSKKIAGILTETKIEHQMVKNLFIGIGFNVNQEEFPEELIDIATSLKKQLGREYEREEIIVEFINKIELILEERIK